jgi:D-alanine-D-alanine ligase
MSGKAKLRVGILFGGRSGEHEVSLASAASVIRALDPEKYEAVPIGITKEGRWLVGAGAQKPLPEVLKSGERVVLPADPSAASLLPVEPAGSRQDSQGIHVDVMFPRAARHVW